MDDTVHVKGLKALSTALQQFPVKMEQNVMRAAMRSGAKVYQLSARGAVSVKSGALRASLRVGSTAKRGTVTAFVRTKIPYARFVEFGTAAHVIQGKNGGWLHIHGDTFVKSVDHPGAKAKPFLRPAFDSQGENALKAVGNKIKDRLDRLGIDTPDYSEG